MSKKIFLSLVTATSMSFAAPQGGSDIGSGDAPTNIKLACEQITVLNSLNKLTDTAAMVHLKPFSIEVKDGEAELDLPVHQTNVSISEDSSLKGLFSVMMTTGEPPMMKAADGTAIQVLLKKNGELNAESMSSDFNFTKLQIKPNQTTESYVVLASSDVNDYNAVLSLTNKFHKALFDLNETLPKADKISFSKQMIIQSVFKLLEDKRVTSLIQKQFSENELLMSGLNSLCLQSK